MALKSGRVGVRNDQVDAYGRIIGGGGGGTEYTAGEGIDITNKTISIDEEVVAVKGDLQDYATIDMLDDYATKAELDDYATTSDLETLETTIDTRIDAIDLEIEGLTDDVADLNSGKLDASKSAVATVGGLVLPSATPTSNELVGVDTSNAQQRITIGSGLTLSNNTLSASGGGGGVTSLGGATGVITLGNGLTMSNNELSASGGGGGGTQLYKHNITGTASDIPLLILVTTSSDTITSTLDIGQANILSSVISVAAFEKYNCLLFNKGTNPMTSHWYVGYILEDKSTNVIQLYETFNEDTVTAL